MTDFVKPICKNCGHKSFRYSKKKSTSYCLTCGEEVMIPKSGGSSVSG